MKKWIAIAWFSVSLAGCKQGPGERCQVDDDCAEGTCSKSEPKTCGGADQTPVDAQPPPDPDAQANDATDAPAD